MATAKNGLRRKFRKTTIREAEGETNFVNIINKNTI